MSTYIDENTVYYYWLVVILVVYYGIVEAFALCHKCALEDDATFFVPLILFRCKLINPTKLGIAVFTRHVTNHMATCQHDTILYLAISEVHHPVEQERSACCTRETSRDQLCAICERRLTTGACKYSRSTQVL